MAKLPTYPVDEDTLRGLLVDHPSEVIRARLAYMEASQLNNHYIKRMVGVPRLYPTMLPTQASGRWSTKNPPLVNFPPSIRDVVVPDKGRKWVHWDYDAIEAKLAALLSHDSSDLTLIRDGKDLHTATACWMFSLPLPPSLHKGDISGGDVCRAWRLDIQWQPKDLRRQLAKTARYALIYGENEKAILNAKGAAEIGVSKAQLLDAGKRYLQSKPLLAQWKRRVWQECLVAKESRTFLGYRRRLMGKEHDIKKEGLNHRIQGAVAGIMDHTLIRVFQCYPEAWLAYQAHDGATISVPREWEDLEGLRGIVEREWEIEGDRLAFTAEWEILFPPDEEAA